MQWYRVLFGLSEAQQFSSVQGNFRVNLKEGLMTSLANGKSFNIGQFSTPTLKSLRAEGLALLGNAKTKDKKVDTRSFSFHHVIQGDVLPEHAKYPGALIQAASQFNCLEFCTPSIVPENGVSMYANDRTQGPACALACGAGTVYRNYLVNVATHSLEGHADPDQINTHDMSDEELIEHHSSLGQRQHKQINNLDLLEKALRNEAEEYFYVKNGYVFTSDESNLHRLDSVINASKFAQVLVHDQEHNQSDGGEVMQQQAEQQRSYEDLKGLVKGGGEVQQQAEQQRSYEDLKGLVKIGLHRDVGIDFSDRFIPAPSGLTISQAYCSALSCAYSGMEVKAWEGLARLVLEAAYEATLWAAVMNTMQIPCESANATAASTEPAPVLASRNNTFASALSAADSTPPEQLFQWIPSFTQTTATTNMTSGPVNTWDHRYKVILTFIGGGVFGNEPVWICDSIGRSLALMAYHNAPIEVNIAHFRKIDYEKVNLIEMAYQRELHNLQQSMP